MSDPTEPVPPTGAAPAGTPAGTARYSVPEVARVLGISERAVRKRITVGTLDAHKEGNAWVVLLPATTEAVPAVLAAPGAVPESGTGGGTAAPDVGQGLNEAIVQLRTLLAEERQRADRYLEASTIWQSRALQLEERLKALESGPIAADIVQNAPQERDSAPQRDDVPAEASDTRQAAWRRWWRRMTGGAVDLS